MKAVDQRSRIALQRPFIRVTWVRMAVVILDKSSFVPRTRKPLMGTRPLSSVAIGNRCGESLGAS